MKRVGPAGAQNPEKISTGTRPLRRGKVEPPSPEGRQDTRRMQADGLSKSGEAYAVAVSSGRAGGADFQTGVGGAAGPGGPASKPGGRLPPPFKRGVKLVSDQKRIKGTTYPVSPEPVLGLLDRIWVAQGGELR